MKKPSSLVAGLIEKARTAQSIYSAYNQHQVDEVVTAIGWSVIQPDNNQELSELAVADTGLGKISDKFIKNRRKTMGLLRDLQNAKSVGVICDDPDKGVIEIARPIGIIGAIVPSTNPVATPTNKVINALKGRNAIILAPSPRGDQTCNRLLELMHVELDRVGAPKGLVQKLPSPVNKESTQALMQSVDLIVATGSQNNIRNAYSSGTPAVGVGAGNVVSIVDESAETDSAARKIATSKSFDNATSCSSENNLIVVDEQYDEMMASLHRAGGQLLSKSDQSQLEKQLWAEGRLNPALIAKEAHQIVTLANLEIEADQGTKFLMVTGDGIGKAFPFSGEKLCPVLTVYRATDFDHAKDLACEIMDYQGRGHSISLHSTHKERALDLGLNLPVCRVIVNQIHCYATGGSFDNGLPFSLSMGCGSWGENSISENMNYKHYLNTTRIAYPIAANEPSEKDLFGHYWKSHHIAAN